MNQLALVFLSFWFFLFTVIALDALYDLPSHGDKDEQQIQHALNLSATLFPEATIQQIEIDFMHTACGCKCGQIFADCICTTPR